MFRSIATTAARQIVRQQPTATLPARHLSTSFRTSFPTQGGAAPTTSESSLGTDRGASGPADAQEGAQDPTLKKSAQTTNTSASSDVNSQPDPAHPKDGTSGPGGVASHSRFEATTQKDGVAAGGNPLKPGATGRGYHTSAVLRDQSKIIDNAHDSAQHPGKSDIDHLENPSLSEEAVHADREPVDPLKAVNTAGGKLGDAASQASATASSVAQKAGEAVKSAADSVKSAFDSATGGAAGGKRGFSTSAARRNDPDAPEEQSAQHPGKSGHDHLDNPSMSEEHVHADRTSKDPLPDHAKAGQKKKAKESAGVKDNVSELNKKGVDELPDGESTLRSMGGGSN
ncbi:hypothetical protein JCM8097_003222 [Rhodosporidiobolus ruineniae]